MSEVETVTDCKQPPSTRTTPATQLSGPRVRDTRSLDLGHEGVRFRMAVEYGRGIEEDGGMIQKHNGMHMPV